MSHAYVARENRTFEAQLERALGLGQRRVPRPPPVAPCEVVGIDLQDYVMSGCRSE